MAHTFMTWSSLAILRESRQFTTPAAAGQDREGPTNHFVPSLKLADAMGPISFALANPPYLIPKCLV